MKILATVEAAKVPLETLAVNPHFPLDCGKREAP